MPDAPALFLDNPFSSRADEIGRPVRRLLSARRNITWLTPRTLDEGRAAIRLFAASGDDDRKVVFIAGGDGTISAYLEALVETGLALVVVPSGTANDLSRALYGPLSVFEACEVGLGQRRRQIDVADVTMADAAPRKFVNAVTVGFGADVTRLQTAERKTLLGRSSYFLSFAEAVRLAEPFRAELLIKEGALARRWSEEVLHISVACGLYHGGGIASGRAAELDDGLLHVSLVVASSLIDTLQSLPHFYLGQHDDGRALVSFQGEQLDLKVAPSIELCADGEPIGSGSAKFEVCPRALTVCVP